MKTKTRRRLPAWCLLLVAIAIPASAQWTTTGSSCSSCQVPSAPITTSVPMPALGYQPIAQYAQVQQLAPVQTTVQTPVQYTEYVNQPVTQMVPVTRRQTRQVPSMEYRTVTQYQTRNRDQGRWVTRYYPNQRLSPCQVDPRPGFGGWMNRTGYGLRSLFTPQYTTKRQYVPNVVAQTVPVRRRVAVPTTRTVAYNVTQMVPQTVNRQVAVNRVRYVTQNLTTMQPALAMAPMSVAPSVAWAPSTVASGTVGWDPFGGSLAAAPVVESTPYDQMAVMTEDQFERRVALDSKLAPIPDRDVPRSARRDRTFDNDADALFEDIDERPIRSSRSSSSASDKYERERSQKRTSVKPENSIRKSSYSNSRPQPARRIGGDSFFDETPPATPRQPAARAIPRAAVSDDFFDDNNMEPTFDDSSRGGDATFDDIPFDTGVEFDQPSASRYRIGRPTAMRRSSNSSVARNDGWTASRSSTRSPSRDNNTILVSHRNP